MTARGRAIVIILGTVSATGLLISFILIASAGRWYPILQFIQARRQIGKLQEEEDDAYSAAKARTKQSFNQELQIDIGRTVEISSSYRYCWFPTVHQFATGEILVTMQMSPDDTNPGGEFSGFSISRDEGQTWSRRYTLGAGANNNAAYSEVAGDEILALGNGYDAVEPDPINETLFHVVLSRFSRAGMTLTQVRDARLELARPAGSEPATLYKRHRKDASQLASTLPVVNPWGNIIEALNGDWLTTIYYKINQDPRSTRVVLARSTDHGVNWKEQSVIAGIEEGQTPWSWIGREGPSETGLVRLADSSLYAIFRTGGYLGEAWSKDDGRTWSKAKPTNFKGVAPRVRRLRSGVLAASFGRPGPVSLIFNADGTGRDWSSVTEVFKRMSTRYSDFIEISPNTIFVVYDSVPYGWDDIPAFDKTAKNVIYGTFVYIHRTGGSSPRR